MPWVRAGGRMLSLADLRLGKSAPYTSFEERVLLFVNQWLNGQDTFSLKTSGSTGAPKTAHFSRAQLTASAKLTEEALNLRRGHTALLCLDISHVGGLMVVVRSLVSGMNLIITEPASNPFEQIPDSLRVDYSSFVPLQVEAILRSSRAWRLDELAYVLIGGAPASTALLEEIAKRKGSWYATYGMTETISHIALQPLTGPRRSDFFTSLPGISLSVDGRGCLVIRADHLGNQPVVTNDVVALISPSEFKWLGRIDHVINSGGYKVHAEQVEKKLEAAFQKIFPKRNYFVAPLPDPRLGQQVVLVVEGDPPGAQVTESLQLWMKDHLHRYECPARVLFIKQFVTTGNGKLLRGATLALRPASP